MFISPLHHENINLSFILNDECMEAKSTYKERTAARQCRKKCDVRFCVNESSEGKAKEDRPLDLEVRIPKPQH